MPLRLGRRRFLRTAGATMMVAAGMHLDTSGAAAQDGSPQLLNGVLRKVSPGAIVVEHPRGRRGVHFARNATFNRNGPAQLADFQVGDRVVIELATKEQEQNDGSHMELRYGYVSSTVQLVEPNRLTTSVRAPSM